MEASSDTWSGLTIIRISSRKVKIVIDLIRGKSVEDAEAILMYTPKAASEPTLKVLRSAIANAVNNLDMDKIGRAHV